MVKQIDDSEFLELSELFIKYNQCLATRHNQFDSIHILVSELSQNGALALGLYRNNKLVGFTLGKRYSSEVFNFTAMYILPEYRYNTKKLFTESEAFIKSLGYTGFVSESSTKEGINMHYKMGCSPIEIKFYKEL